MTNPSKSKGTRFESELVTYLNQNGAPHAERRAPNGNKDRGDITGAGPIVWEAKACKTMALSTWVDEMLAECANAGTRLGAVIHKRRGTHTRRSYVTLQLDQYCQLLHEAGYLTPTDTP